VRGIEIATLVSKSKLDSFSRVEGLRVFCDDYLPGSKKERKAHRGRGRRTQTAAASLG